MTTDQPERNRSVSSQPQSETSGRRKGFPRGSLSIGGNATGLGSYSAQFEPAPKPTAKKVDPRCRLCKHWSWEPEELRIGICHTPYRFRPVATFAGDRCEHFQEATQ